MRENTIKRTVKPKERKEHDGGTNTSIGRLGKMIRGTRTQRKGMSHRKWGRKEKEKANWTRPNS